MENNKPTVYGCHNRDDLNDTAMVQDGWVASWIAMYGEKSRKPILIEIADPMTKQCKYQELQKNDKKCILCKHLKEAE